MAIVLMDMNFFVWKIHVGVYGVCTCLRMCTHVYVCMSMWRSVLGTGIFFDHSLLYFSGQSLNEHRAEQFGSVGWAVSIRDHHWLWLQMCAASHGFYVDAEGMNSSPHACTTVNLLPQPSLQQFHFHL